MNRVILVGNLGKDVELRQTKGGTPVANFSLATKEFSKDQSGQSVEKTEWHSIVVWGKTAENVNKYLSKGSKVLVEGKLATRQWEKDGQKHYSTEVIANGVQFLDSKKEQTLTPAYAAQAGGSEPTHDFDAIPF